MTAEITDPNRNLDAYIARLPRYLHDMPYGWAERLPDGAALIEGETVWTWRRFADEIAAAASLIQGQADEGIPVVVVRGLGAGGAERRGVDLVRAREQDLFR